jgi:competence protein ComEC
MNWWILKRRLHLAWLIAVLCLGILLGVFLARYTRVSYIQLTVSFALSMVIIIIVSLRKYVYLIPLLIVGGVLLGLWRGTMLQGELAKFEQIYGKNVSVRGTVEDDADIGTSEQIVVRLGHLAVDGSNLPGTFRITSKGEDIKRGDVLLVEGVLQEGFGNFVGVIYRANISAIIHPQPGDIARIVRDWFADAIRLAVPEPEASLGIGYLVGQRRSLSADLVLALQAAGLTHIVVASGYNLTILVRITRRLLAGTSKYLAFMSAAIMIMIFIAITGASPSMLRAGLVAGLSLAAWYYGRNFHPIILLLLVAAITVLINPSYVWNDLGWQLSFAAFAGVMIISPLFQRYLFGDKKPGMIRQIMGETVAAQLATAPIIIFAFGQVSNVAILSNLLVLPLVPLAMLLTFIAGIGGLIMPAVATFIGAPAFWLLGYMVNVAEYLASLPWAVSVVKFPWWGVVISYLVIIGSCLYIWYRTGFNLREVNLVE